MAETKLFPQSMLSLPQGTMYNGKIVPSVSSNNLTVALKGLDGNDPSATNPVYVRIGDTVRSITAALSVTKNAGTNWCNAGGAELATKEIDYFVYLGYNATDGVVIGFSRVPCMFRYDGFSTTSTAETYCAISTITTAAAGDQYEVIGRFAATLSAGAGYTWTVPTFTAVNLIQKPIHESRLLTVAGVFTGFSANPTDVYFVYKVSFDMCHFHPHAQTGGTSNANTFTISSPFLSYDTGFGAWIGYGRGTDNGAATTYPTLISLPANTRAASLYKDFSGAVWTTSASKNIGHGQIIFKILGT